MRVRLCTQLLIFVLEAFYHNSHVTVHLRNDVEQYFWLSIYFTFLLLGVCLCDRERESVWGGLGKRTIKQLYAWKKKK